MTGGKTACRTWQPVLIVHFRIRPALLLGDLQRGADLNERPFAYAGAIRRSALPLAAVFDQLGPERKRAALGGLGGMNRAAVALEKRALFFGRLAKTQLAPRAVDIFGLERARGDTDEFRSAFEIGFGEIDKALLVAAVHASALAGEAKGSQALIVACFSST